MASFNLNECIEKVCLLARLACLRFVTRWPHKRVFARSLEGRVPFD